MVTPTFFKIIFSVSYQFFVFFFLSLKHTKGSFRLVCCQQIQINRYSVTFDFSQYSVKHLMNDPEGKKTTIRSSLYWKYYVTLLKTNYLIEEVKCSEPSLVFPGLFDWGAQKAPF
jgi:hypothetical protein